MTAKFGELSPGFLPQTWRCNESGKEKMERKQQRDSATNTMMYRRVDADNRLQRERRQGVTVTTSTRIKREDFCKPATLSISSHFFAEESDL
jgi:hypothetical protein